MPVYKVSKRFMGPVRQNGVFVTEVEGESFEILRVPLTVLLGHFDFPLQ